MAPGEQPMLAIGRALMTPDLLILHQAAKSLAPWIRTEDLVLLAVERQSILLIDKHLAPSLSSPTLGSEAAGRCSPLTISASDASISRPGDGGQPVEDRTTLCNGYDDKKCGLLMFSLPDAAPTTRQTGQVDHRSGQENLK